MVAGIPPDISYGLECSVECLSITSDVITYYHMFNETPLAPIVDARDYCCTPEGLGESLRGLARLYMRLYNDWYWTKASALERAWCVASAAERFPRIAGEAADFLVTKFISEMLARDLDPHSRRNQQEWLDRSREMTHIEKVVAQLSRKASVVPADLLGDVIRHPSNFFTSLGDIAPPRSCFTSRDAVQFVDGTVNFLLSKKSKRNKQKVLKKSAAFLSTLIAPNDVSMFVGGKEIRVEGHRYVFVLSKDNILSTNHGAISIKVHDKDTDRRLFNLCWYVQDTPALDQLAALAMAVRAGDEDEIIRVGNMLRVDQSAIAELRPDLLFEPYCPNAPDDLVCSGSGTVGPTGPSGLVFPDDDTLMHLTKGTTEFHRSNPSVYLDFARRFRNRLKPVKGAETHFIAACPTTIRPFVDGRVGRELLPDPANTPIDELLEMLA